MAEIVFAKWQWALPMALLCAGCAAEQQAEIRSVPAPLAQIEGDAEHAYDAAIASDFQTVSADAAVITDNWQAFKAQAVKDGAASADVDAMDLAVSGLVDAAGLAKGRVEVGRAANAVSGPVAHLYAVYQPTIPAELNELDYLGREVALDGMQPDLAAAAIDIDRVEAAWKPLRPSVVSTGSEKDAASFDDSISAERDAVVAQDASLVVGKANAQLDLVDVLEQLFLAAAQADPPD